MPQLQLRQHPHFRPAAGPAQPLAEADALLLAWLALEGPTPRSRLARLMWPGKAEETARNSLRQRLFKLRRQLGLELVTGQHTLALAAGVAHDLHDAAQPLLAATTLAPEGELGAWLLQQRTQRQARQREALAAQADAAEQAQDWPAALQAAQALLALEPLAEDAHRRLMRLHYLQGDRAAALRAFDACEHLLKDEVGTPPSAETLALLQHLQTEQPAAALPQRRAGLPASVLRPPRLVGRERELAALAQAWGEGHVVALVGEAGLGKTRLLQAFAEAQGLPGGAAARPGDAGVPYATLARLLRTLWRAAELTAPAALPAPARQDLARVLPEFEAPVAGVPPPSIAPGASAGFGGTPGSGEGQRLALLRGVQSMLQALPALHTVLLDDLHFADTASLELLGPLIDGDEADTPHPAPALRWVLAYRPAEAGTPLQALQDRLADEARLARVPLAPLDTAALAALVDSLALPGLVGARVAPLLARRTGGNPLFVLETLKQAWAEGTLTQLQEAPAARGSGAGATALPATLPATLPAPLAVGRLIERRLALLSPAALTLARVAAIATPDFSLELAAQVLGQPVMAFADALNELEQAQVLRGLQFAHDLVFEAVHTSVPAAVAGHTHAAVAAWLEAHGGEPARVARHWRAAGQDARAIPWLGRAAAAAERAVRRLEQIHFLEEMSTLQAAAGELDAAFTARLRAAELQVTVDEGEAGARTLDALAALARSPAQQVQVQLQRAHHAAMRGELASAEQLAAQTLREALRHGVDEALLVQCRHHLANALVAQQRGREALVHQEAMLPWVRQHADDAFRVEFHDSLAQAYEAEGRLGDAGLHHQLALAAVRRTGEHGNLVLVLGNCGSHALLQGRLAEADDWLAQARRVRVQDDNAASLDAFIGLNEAIADYTQGRYTRALATLAEAEAGLGRFAPAYRPSALSHLAVVWARLGQWARMQQAQAEVAAAHGGQPPASFVLRRALLLEERAQAQGREPQPGALDEVLAATRGAAVPDLFWIAEIQALLREPGPAALRRALPLIDRLRQEGHEGALLSALAQLARRSALAGEAAASRGQAAEALTLAGRVLPVRDPVLMPALHLAEAALARGEPEAAAPLVQHALAWLQARVAQGDVPPECRDSFLERVPCHRALRALAARHGWGALALR